MMAEEKDYLIENEKIHIKEWKKDIFIRAITFEEQQEWEKSLDKENPMNSMAKLVSLSVLDEHGNPLWDESVVRKLPAKIVQKLHMACLKVSGLRKKDFDDLIKNFEADLPD
jgi:hypothetical protein